MERVAVLHVSVDNFSSPQVLVEEKRFVRLLTLNRTKQLNALSFTMVRLAIAPFNKAQSCDFLSTCSLFYCVFF